VTDTVTVPVAPQVDFRGVLLFLPEVEIQSRDRESLVPNAETVSHHETGKLRLVDQPDGRSARTRAGAPRALGEASGGDEHSLGRAEAVDSGEEAIPS